ncbi:MAG: tetratricopeptide repeat protein [Candidatus Magasanikbacteria bacterium]|nr:tetratricopeptide repeat protein [Candidatus Magasanikbacteria bacterium]
MIIIFAIIILLSLGAIGYVVAPKIPQLASIETEHLPEERQARKKKEIILKRIEQEGKLARERWVLRLAPVGRLWAVIQFTFRRYVGRVERLWRHEESVKKRFEKSRIPVVETRSQLSACIKEGENALAAGAFNKAEEYFIGAIKLDTKSVAAYRGLADTYSQQGAETEAEETYRFLFKLDPTSDTVAVKLGEIAAAKNNIQEAIEWYQQAVLINDSLSPRFYRLAELFLAVQEPQTAREAILSAVALEPKNPKYLDLLIETAILAGDRKLAEQSFQELRLVNPDNQKLVSFKERIEKM